MLYLRFSVEVGHEKWIENILEVNRVPGRVTALRLALDNNLLYVLSGYTLHSRLTVEGKIMFCDDLLATSVRMR